MNIVAFRTHVQQIADKFDSIIPNVSQDQTIPILIVLELFNRFNDAVQRYDLIHQWDNILDAMQAIRHTARELEHRMKIMCLPMTVLRETFEYAFFVFHLDWKIQNADERCALLNTVLGRISIRLRELIAQGALDFLGPNAIFIFQSTARYE